MLTYTMRDHDEVIRGKTAWNIIQTLLYCGMSGSAFTNNKYRSEQCLTNCGPRAVSEERALKNYIRHLMNEKYTHTRLC
jgi:hypothetical protein